MFDPTIPARAVSDPAIPMVDGTCHFFRLPREMREYIYELAYAEAGSIKLVSKGRHRIRTSVASFSGVLLEHTPLFRWKGRCRFLVCKTWFLEAHPIYLRKNTFHLTDTQEVVRFLNMTIAKANVESISFEYAIPILGDIPDHMKGFGYVRFDPLEFLKTPPVRVAPALNSCKRLRSVVVEVNWVEYQGMLDLSYGEDRQARVEEHEKMKEDLKQIQGLRAIGVVQSFEGYEHAVQGFRDMIVKKVAELEVEVRKAVLKPKA